MTRITQKAIREISKSNRYTDITKYNFDMMDEFLKYHNLEKLYYSMGRCGANGCVLRDTKTGKLYVITARNTALAMAF